MQLQNSPFSMHCTPLSAVAVSACVPTASQTAGDAHASGGRLVTPALLELNTSGISLFFGVSEVRDMTVTSCRAVDCEHLMPPHDARIIVCPTHEYLTAPCRL